MIDYIFFVFGIYVLIKSSDWIVDGASSLAKKFGVSSLVIGLTVVAFGTSLPELVVNLFAAFGGSGEVAFGNIIGSNIANILLVLGIVAVMGKIHIQRDTVWKEIPFAMLAAFVLGVLIYGNEFLGRSDGFILLALFGVFLYYVVQAARENRGLNVEEVVDKSGVLVGLKLCMGMIGIYFAGQWVVDGAIVIANAFGMSEYLISATIIAIGTSLPELVVSIVAVLKRNSDLAVGNIIGSNIFNIFWVLGIVPVINPIAIPSFIVFDVGIMFLATLTLFLFMFAGEEHELRRTDGILMLIGYVAYIWFVVVRG